MRDDSIKKALLNLTPNEALERRIDGMIERADIDAVMARQTKSSRRSAGIRRRARVLLVAAATLAMMVAAVSAYGIYSRLFYLPNVGLVNEDGQLVIREDSIGSLEGITAYKMLDAVDFGDYSIENVTYTEQDGQKSYAVWTQMDELMLEESRGSEGIPFSERVIDDLCIVLPDGTTMVPDSARWGYSGYIVYNFTAGELNESFTVASASLGESVDVQLYQVTNVGYSYMEYPTDKGITLSIYPVNEAFTQYELAFVDNAIADGFEEYIKGTTIKLPYETTVFTTADGSESYMREQHSRFAFKDGGGWSTTSYRELDFIEGSTYNDKKDGYGYYHWLEIDTPVSGKITNVEIPALTISYSMNKATYVEIPMPADGEYVDEKVTIFDAAGFLVELCGYERNGSVITIYMDKTAIGEDDLWNGSGIKTFSVQIPYSGSSELSAAWASPSLRCPSHAYVGEDESGSGAVGANRGKWYDVGDGRIARDFELEVDDVVVDAEDYAFFWVSNNFIACDYEGNWNISYTE